MGEFDASHNGVVCQFQVILNMRLRSTEGQATPSVVLGLMGQNS